MTQNDRGAAGGPGGAFRFRVSDSLAVPLRGHLLRLRRVEGRPALSDLGVGRQLKLVGRSGASRAVTIRAHSVTSGRMTQARLDAKGELDVVITTADAQGDSAPVGIGWFAEGPVDRDGGGDG